MFRVISKIIQTTRDVMETYVEVTDIGLVLILTYQCRISDRSQKTFVNARKRSSLHLTTLQFGSQEAGPC
jgi:hypothetical protein